MGKLTVLSDGDELQEWGGHLDDKVTKVGLFQNSGPIDSNKFQVQIRPRQRQSRLLCRLASRRVERKEALTW